MRAYDDDYIVSCAMAAALDDQYQEERKRYQKMLSVFVILTLLNTLFILLKNMSSLEGTALMEKSVALKRKVASLIDNAFSNLKERVPAVDRAQQQIKGKMGPIREVHVSDQIFLWSGVLWYLTTGITQLLMATMMTLVLLPTCPVFCLEAECKILMPPKVVPFLFLFIAVVWLQQAYEVWKTQLSPHAQAAAALREPAAPSGLKERLAVDLESDTLPVEPDKFTPPPYTGGKQEHTETGQTEERIQDLINAQKERTRRLLNAADKVVNNKDDDNDNHSLEGSNDYKTMDVLEMARDSESEDP